MPNPPTIIDTNAATIFNELVADFQTRTGRLLQAGQVETALLSSWAYREALVRSAIQNAAVMNLVDFAIAPILDYHGKLVGVTRIPATFATCTLRFTLVTGHGGGTIPAGTRVGSTDGKVIFTTMEAVSFISGATTVDVLSQCDVEGVAGNGYVSSTITSLLTPNTQVQSVRNTGTTTGGADQETDEQLRERIKIASSAYSTAGSRQAYIFHAKSAHPSITDVYVTSDDPGVVKIYPKVAGGIVTPEATLTAVQVACSAETVRPLCDTVQVISPTKIDYTIEVILTIFSDYDASDVIARVTASLVAYNSLKSETLGQNIIPEQLIAACMVEGVYSLSHEFVEIDVDVNEFAYCTDIDVSVGGTTNG